MPSLQKLFAVFAVSFNLAGAQLTKCDPDNKCPQSSPCCSAYGQCGVGAYCLGGCDPRSSFSLRSCTPSPTCKSEDFSFSNLDGMQSNTVYLGDASEANWVTEGTPVIYNDDTLLLTMAESTVGTLLASTHYVWYGTISAKMKTSSGAGVVTAFIMMSDVKDEIDFEFIGTETDVAQSNFYWQGTKNYTNSANLTAPSTNTEWHEYTIDWQPDKLTWSVDGKILRTLNRADTVDSQGQTKYPQSPSRIMISLWPAGLESNGAGTVAWSGGLIDWNSPSMQNGYYYAQLKEVSVKCADGYPSDAQVSGSNSFTYTDYSGMEDSVAVTGDKTTLASFLASGENPSYNPHATKPKSGKESSAPENVQTVPGVVGGGVRGSTDNGGSDGDTTLNGGGNGAADPAAGSNLNSFSQGLDTNKAASGKTERALHGSAFAVLVAFVALIVL